jgi:hypothetical protein
MNMVASKRSLTIYLRIQVSSRYKVNDTALLRHPPIAFRLFHDQYFLSLRKRQLIRLSSLIGILSTTLD